MEINGFEQTPQTFSHIIKNKKIYLVSNNNPIDRLKEHFDLFCVYFCTRFLSHHLPNTLIVPIYELTHESQELVKIQQQIKPENLLIIIDIDCVSPDVNTNITQIINSLDKDTTVIIREPSSTANQNIKINFNLMDYIIVDNFTNVNLNDTYGYSQPYTLKHQQLTSPTIEKFKDKLGQYKLIFDYHDSIPDWFIVDAKTDILMSVYEDIIYSPTKDTNDKLNKNIFPLETKQHLFPSDNRCDTYEVIFNDNNHEDKIMLLIKLLINSGYNTLFKNIILYTYGFDPEYLEQLSPINMTDFKKLQANLSCKTTQDIHNIVVIRETNDKITSKFINAQTTVIYVSTKPPTENELNSLRFYISTCLVYHDVIVDSKWKHTQEYYQQLNPNQINKYFVFEDNKLFPTYFELDSQSVDLNYHIILSEIKKLENKNNDSKTDFTQDNAVQIAYHMESINKLHEIKSRLEETIKKHDESIKQHWNELQKIVAPIVEQTVDQECLDNILDKSDYDNFDSYHVWL